MPFTDPIRAAARSAAVAAIGLTVVAAHAEEHDPSQSASSASASTSSVAAHSEQPASSQSALGASESTNSTAVLSTTDLEERGITTLDGIAAALPAISSTPALNSLSTLSLYMRGEGPAAPGQITLDGAVGLYQDGFYISRLQANTFDLLDLERALR
jgi:iron complex outermembrane receptor protein